MRPFLLPVRQKKRRNSAENTLFCSLPGARGGVTPAERKGREKMVEKELRRMNRAELIEIIYEYEKRVRELEQANADLKEKLDDRMIRIGRAGSIAEASLDINRIFGVAQRTADQYLASISAVYEELESNREQLLGEARREAAALRERGQREYENRLARAEAECTVMRRRITEQLMQDDSLRGLMKEWEDTDG